MSKMDNLRAMREARFERSAAPPARRPVARPPVSPPAPSAKVMPDRAAAQTPDQTGAASADPADDGLCGHRSMNGRTCTRERGHTAKSHRYS